MKPFRILQSTPSNGLLGRNVPISSRISMFPNTSYKNIRISKQKMCTINRFESRRRFSTPIPNAMPILQNGYAWIDDTTKSVNVQLSNGLGQFLYLFLRDHCTCPSCFHSVTLQRVVDTLTIPRDIEAASLEHNGNGLVIQWSDGHQSEYSYSWLEEMKLLQDSVQSPLHQFPNKPNKVPWNASIPLELASISYDEVNSGDKGVKKWLDLIHQYGFALVTGLKEGQETSEQLIDKTKELCQKISYIRNTFYGGYWDFTANLELSDMAYTNLELHVHNDGTYFQDPPGIQVFHLLEFDGVGGQTVLVDGLNIVQQLKAQDPEAFNFLSTTPIPFHYMDNDRFMMQRRTIFEMDAFGDLVRFWFNNNDRAPVTFDLEKQQKFYDALFPLLTLLREPQNSIVHQLTPGNAIFIDNWRVLHGRKSFQGHRRLSGCYLNREDFTSKLKALSEKLAKSQ